MIAVESSHHGRSAVMALLISLLQVTDYPSQSKAHLGGFTGGDHHHSPK